MTFRPFCILLFLTLAAALGFSRIALAQTPTPASGGDAGITASPLLCDPADLRAQQALLASRLSTFAIDSAVDADAALQALFDVGLAYQTLALDCGYIPPDAGTRTVGTDVERILNTLATLYGDPLAGQVLYDGELACASCHIISGGEVAPPTEGTFTRIEETRLADPALGGYTPEQYLVESIVNPSHYVVPGYQNVMPNNFGERLTAQELADLVAYLLSQDGPSPE